MNIRYTTIAINGVNIELKFNIISYFSYKLKTPTPMSSSMKLIVPELKIKPIKISKEGGRNKGVK